MELCPHAPAEADALHLVCEDLNIAGSLIHNCTRSYESFGHALNKLVELLSAHAIDPCHSPTA